MQKICKRCELTKSIECFSKQKTNKDGYKNICKTCVAEYGRKHRENNLDKERERAKQYYQNNYESRLEYRSKTRNKKNQYAKQYREKNKQLLSEKQKINYIKKKDIIRIKSREYYRKKITNDPMFKFKKDIQLLIRDAFRRKDLSKENKRTIDILGCSIGEFKLYLESKFQPWMNWDNRGLYNGAQNYGWDIDHIIPLKTAKTVEDIIKLNHYTNLQPLCSYINRVVKKSNT